MRRVALALILSSLLPGAARAEDPVHFPDANLKAAVEAELGFSNPTPTDMLSLTSLRIPLTWEQIGAISDLTGLDYAYNLTELNLRYHKVSDLKPLSYLTHLQSLALLGNGISNISPLSSLKELDTLDLESNNIGDITALSGLTSLSSLCLHRNFVSDVSPLTSLKSLRWVDLRALPLSQTSLSTYIPEIKANNPGATVLYDGFYAGELVISSSFGGSVIKPGEGTFPTVFGDSFTLEAEPDPGFVFAGWTGTMFTTENPLFLTIDQDYNLRANFVSILHTIHVDDNAPADPGPANSAVSDPQENGTVEHPFDSIQEAINVAAKGAAIFVHAGTYREKIDLLGKRVEITGFEPNNPGTGAWPVIDGNGSGPVVNIIHGEDQSCVLSGLVITGGKNRDASAIQCVGSGPTITNCLIAGNRATDLNGAVIVCTESSAAFINCTVVDNRGGQLGAGMSVVNGRVTAANSIFWGNWPKETTIEADELPRMRYTLIAPDWWGPGNLNKNPLFACLGRWVDRTDPNVTVWPDSPNATWVMGDYHLQSQTGRWDPKMADWTLDTVTSPCVDGGDPTTPVGREPLPNGGTINMGVYGGTIEASRSLSPNPSP